MSLAMEQSTGRTSRWLRDRRLKIALWIAVVEGILVVVDVVDWWLALVVGAAVLAFYLFVGRRSSSDSLRHVSWIAAASQLMVALVPVLVFVVGTLALVAVALLAVVALLFLLTDRR